MTTRGLTFEFDRAPLRTTIAVTGDIDLATVDSLTDQAMTALDEHIDLLIIDLAGVGFCDSAGLSCLIKIRNHGAQHGQKLQLTNLKPLVSHVIVSLSGLGEFFGIEQPADPAE